MNVFGIGLPEMVVIFVLALLIFGPKKLPEVGRSLGKAVRGFQEASEEFKAEIKREAERIEQPPTPPAPMQATLESSQQALSPSPTSTVTEAERVSTPSQED
ncbi:MAG: TatA/E family twin arginine-targeting protein translocase [Leptolyngbyaceae cyanobacterium bins.59]|nr:TatA/E family twin arginine-targeting protein translocase [Leptolyngbyaceae cyanobacterium bins.59]